MRDVIEGSTNSLSRDYLLFFRFFKCLKFYSQASHIICLFIYYGGVVSRRGTLEEESEAPRALCSSLRGLHVRTSSGVSRPPRPIVSLEYSKETPDKDFFVSSSKDGNQCFETPRRAIGLARLKAIEVRVGTPL